MRTRLPALGSVAVVAAVLSVLPFVLSDYNVYLAAEVGVFFIAVLGLNILTGYTGQISIGHGAFMAIGAYVTAILSRDHHTNLVLTMLVSFAACFVIGLIVGLPALRLSGVSLALATFALAVSVPQLPLQWSTYLGGSLGVQASSKPSSLFGISMPGVANLSNQWIYGVAWTSSALLFAVAWLILRGRVGRAFRAVRDSEIAAVASGVELGLYKTLAFGISAAYAGVAGSLFVMASNGFAQSQDFLVVLSLQLLIGAAVAGLGSLWGVLVGAAFVGLLPKISGSVPIIGSDHGRDVVYGLLVILVMLVLPGGFAGLLARLRLLAQGLNRESNAVKLR
jgi:branched-chain amino acid transport system permease protein